MRGNVNMTLAEVAGANARKIRREASIPVERFTRAAHHHRLRWTAGKTGSFESGHVSPTLPMLLKVAAVLSAETGRSVTLADLFGGAGYVRLDDKGEVVMTRPGLRKALSGGRVAMMITTALAVADAAEADFESWHPSLQHVDLALREQIHIDFTETDYRAAKELDVSSPHAAAAMAKAWGKTFVARRNELAGPDGNAQKRGQVSRKLKAELRETIDGND
jgi:hypothetical protein